MKKTTLLLAGMFLVCGQALFAQDYHWPLQANADEIVAGLNGTLVGNVTFITDVNKGDVAYFDGTDSYISLPSFVNGLDEVTISLWFRCDVGAGLGRLWSIGNGFDDGAGHGAVEPKDHMTLVLDMNKTQFYLSPEGGVPPWPWAHAITAVDTIKYEVWHHSVIVLTADEIRGYQDGVEILMEAATRNFSTIDDSQNMLPRSMWDDDIPFNGALSDLQVFKRALSADEVGKLFDGTLGISDHISNGQTPNIYTRYNRIVVDVAGSLGDEQVSVFDIAGKLVAEKPVSKIGDISLGAGLYVVKVLDYSAKVVVQ
ncbi:MAG: LamG-like jellyroll fold domain-containing protein [Bacteroidota bacterium]